MKFLSELRTCCGGSVVTMAVEEKEKEKETELNHLASNRVVSRGRKLKKMENWKPVLHVISEDKTIVDVDRYSYKEKTVGNSGNGKKASKVGVKSGRASNKFGDGYWKMSYAIAIPAFSGTLFLS